MQALQLSVNGVLLDVRWEQNPAVEALLSQVRQGPVTVETEAYGGFEQVGGLPWGLPTNDVPLTTQPGDIMLFSGDQIVLFHGSNRWSYTPLGHIQGMSQEDLAQLLGGPSVTVELRLA